MGTIRAIYIMYCSWEAASIKGTGGKSDGGDTCGRTCYQPDLASLPPPPPCPLAASTTYAVPCALFPAYPSFEQHRNLQPTGPPAQPGPPPQTQSRLNEAFDIIRQEHDLLISEMTIVRSQRDELENKGTPYKP